MRFLVTDDRAGIGRYEVRFDAAGNATNVTIHSNTTGMITGNGLSLKQIGHDNPFIDLQDFERERLIQSQVVYP